MIAINGIQRPRITESTTEKGSIHITIGLNAYPEIIELTGIENANDAARPKQIPGIENDSDYNLLMIFFACIYLNHQKFDQNVSSHSLGSQHTIFVCFFLYIGQEKRINENATQSHHYNNHKGENLNI
jgi:hypothetical protein